MREQTLGVNVGKRQRRNGRSAADAARDRISSPGSQPSRGNPKLIDCLRREIVAQGPISFAHFMELALYHPEYGYYASGRARIGRKGDFFTNVSVGPIFGRLLARQVIEIWEQLGRPASFQIVEQGGHDGALASDILRTLRDYCAPLHTFLRYTMVEPWPKSRQRQEESLGKWGDQVRWRSRMEEVEPFTGVHVSNELWDALPVHLLISSGEEKGAASWREQFVDFEGDTFVFVTGALSREGLKECVRGLPSRPSGYQTEVNLVAASLMREVSHKLERGVILALDYGLIRADFYAHHREQGTLQVRSRQRKLSSPFCEIGCADISAHVEWTSLAEAGGPRVEPIGFADQHHFFTGILTGLVAPSEVEKFTPRDKRALQTLLHPEMLGRSFQVLALGKDFSSALSGFRFAGDASTRLGFARTQSSNEAV